MTTLNITDLVTYKGEGFRIRGFKKRVEDNFPNNPIDLSRNWDEVEIDDFILDLIEQDLLKEKFSRAEQGLPHNKRWRYQNCRKEEATHVSLYGLTYPTAPIDEVIYDGPIGWTPELIEQETRSAFSDHRLIYYPFSEWFWE